MDQKRDGVTELALRSRFVLSRIAAIYPDLARYLKQLSDVLAVEVQLVDGAGHTLATFSFDSARLETTLHAFWRDGSLVASQAGKPLPHVKPVYSQLSARVDAEVALRGVRVSVRNFRTRLRYTERAHGASLQLNARDMPEIEVRGAAFGFVPTALVDLFIPGDLKGLATRFYRALTQGNQGRGFAASLVFEHDPESGLTTIEGDAGAEILDNGLLRFALSAMSDRLLPDEKQENDLRRLAIAYRDAFDQDLARFARYGQIPD